MQEGMRESKVNSRYKFNEKTWVISVLNSGASTSGHNMIVVEGIVSEGPEFHPKLFVGQYDITAATPDDDSAVFNVKSYVNSVRVYEGDKYGKFYGKFQSASFQVSPDKAKKMILSIKQDQARVERSETDESQRILYQTVGKKSLLSQKGAGENCASWCRDKLEIAGVSAGGVKDKPQKVAGGWCSVM